MAETGLGYGHFVIAGMSFPIHGIELREGRIWFLASRPGPFDCPGGPVTIFGEDGRGIGQGGVFGPVSAEDGVMLEMKIDLLFETIE